ncbi:Glyoxylate/hydroxypyruvate reductase B [subsurface metagenome]
MRKKVLLVQPIHSEGIELLEKEVEVIGRHGVGVDNIDIKTASKYSIPVVYTPGVTDIPVAEHALGFMVTLAKRYLITDRALREGKFKIREEFSAVDLNEKTLGIIGVGRIGSTMAQKCKAAFNMKVLAYDPYLSPDKAKQMGIILTGSLTELLQKSDFVTIHTPLTAETENLIGKEELGQMKKSAFLINTARGGIVNEKALFQALKKKWIAGAALDVFLEEPPPSDHPLFGLENIVLSPHMASLTRECVVTMARVVAQGVLDVLGGKRPQYIVNPDSFKDK